ncbi:MULTISPECIES: hypothetical protein [Burkholderia cepacia complex]|uniref:hypothetical protein n=1 Tax=Burkholderia cepacia complex TaxID=87882 RepID=UPI0012D9A4F2|nr:MULTISPECIES: hypothetical protein [Burkholderia cepacia complex]MCW3581611.1 hypothetical protein [Burkholderia cenocepacia]MCW3626815.1 hypothetical protein [Burkholderia cenocepacia]MCW5178949.1 hypothetical protein [Burkholderia cenocepacia]
MQTNSEDISTNVGLVRKVLGDMGLIIAQSRPAALPTGMNNVVLRFRDPTWTCVLFTHEDEALVRIYAGIAELGGATRVRVLEAVNYANYRFLMDYLMELDLEQNNIRLRSNYRGAGAHFSPSELKEALTKSLGIYRYWACTMPLVLASNLPMEAAFKQARAESAARNNLPPNITFPNM